MDVQSLPVIGENMTSSFNGQKGTQVFHLFAA